MQIPRGSIFLRNHYPTPLRKSVAFLSPILIYATFSQLSRWLHPAPVRLTGFPCVSIIPHLQTVLDASPCGVLTFLVTSFGRPFSIAGFGNKFREWCDEAGLTHCTSHGHRKAAATRLADLGCSAHEIMAITGYKTLEEVQRYTRAADQKWLAKTAMDRVSKVEG